MFVSFLNRIKNFFIKPKETFSLPAPSLSLQQITNLQQLEVGNIVEIKLRNSCVYFWLENNLFTRFSREELERKGVVGIVSSINSRPDMYLEEDVVEVVLPTRNGFVKTIPILETEIRAVTRLIFFENEPVD